jgi:hypothetical protein
VRWVDCETPSKEDRAIDEVVGDRSTFAMLKELFEGLAMSLGELENLVQYVTNPEVGSEVEIQR